LTVNSSYHNVINSCFTLFSCLPWHILPPRQDNIIYHSSFPPDKSLSPCLSPVLKRRGIFIVSNLFILD
jgi:hypothetical protein